ncbi:DNA-binding protein [Endozoicomonas sp. Mp262]|uniref:DNA-binding protein n=1 Tax=Endozoicomonas sp. Mp262 TaxID=2919499 RepID=UPI0021DA9EBC
MAQSKVLVDSNSYFRLAKSIHPLLFQTFGEDEYCLYVLPELDNELGKSRRLKSKFAWASDDEYIENRKHYPSVGKKQSKAIDDAYDYIWNYIETESPGPSKVDARYLAYAYVLGISVVTDDADMLAVAKVFNIKTLKTLDLMKLMVDSGHIDMNKVREIVGFWRYWGDMPSGEKNFKQHYRRLFEEPPP